MFQTKMKVSKEKQEYVKDRHKQRGNNRKVIISLTLIKVFKNISIPPGHSSLSAVTTKKKFVLLFNFTILSKQEVPITRKANRLEKNILDELLIGLDVISYHSQNANCAITIYNNLMGAMEYLGQ